MSAASKPDRRGLAPGARWELTAPPQAAGSSGASAGARVRCAPGRDGCADRRASRFLFAEDGIEAELRLEPTDDSRTQATLTVEGGWLRLNHSLPRSALNRLHALCQTAAEL